MLECSHLFGCEFAAHLGILGGLQVCQEVFLGLSALIVAILLGVHGQLKQLFVVLTIFPAVLVHLLAEVVERVGQQRVRVCICKFATLLLGQRHQFGIDGTGYLATLAEDHTPHGLVHHHKPSLALLDGEEVHQRDVLHILAERSNQWRIAHARPHVFHFAEEFHEHVVHRQLLLALLLAQVVDGLANTAQVGHHTAHHAAGQTAAEQQ